MEKMLNKLTDEQVALIVASVVTNFAVLVVAEIIFGLLSMNVMFAICGILLLIEVLAGLFVMVYIDMMDKDW